MVLAEMLREHYEKRDAKEKAAIEKVMVAGREKGIVEGKEKGIAEGAERMNRKWAEWNRKRLEAAERGEEFTESPPDPSDLNSADSDEQAG